LKINKDGLYYVHMLRHWCICNFNWKW